jgi:Phage tail assembly chaperone proteins, E, or 41 or 14
MQLTLKHPVEHNGKTLMALTLRRAKGKDMVHLERLSKVSEASGDVWPVQLDLIASLTDQPRALMDEIDSEDLGRLMEAVNDFLSGTPSASPADGAPSSPM